MTVILLCASILLGAILISIKTFVKTKREFLKFRVRQDDDSLFYLIAKISAIIIFVLFFIRINFSEVFETIVNKDRLFSADFTVVMVVVRAVLAGSIFLLVLSPWFNYRGYMNAVAIFGTIAYIVNIIFYKQNIQAMLGFKTNAFRQTLFSIELVLGLATCLLYLYKRIRDNDKHKLHIQAILTVVFFFGFSFLVMNNYTFSNLTNVAEDGKHAIDFNKSHILILLIMFAVTIALSAFFRNVKDKTYLHAFLATASLIALINYVYGKYYCEFAITKLPLHICNTGVFLMVISFTVKSKPIFYFNYLVNIVGTLLAMLMPDYDIAVFSHQGISYWSNHVFLFILPIVAVAGGFYERPKLKYVKYSIIVFTIYFLVVAFLDAIWQDKVNYFLLNGDSVVENFIWGPQVKNQYVVYFTWLGLNFRVFYLYWIIDYIIYIGFVLLAWFVFAVLYRVTDGYADLIVRSRQNSKAMAILKEQMGGRKKTERLHPENKGKVVISHFTKIYDGETRKAVDDFSLEIEPGTVYGFLGHNGAGKSTTIKSLVGIQTITEGSMEIDGYDLVRQPVKAKMSVGYVSDNHTVYERLTGREYINYVADLYMVSEKDRDERIAKYAKMFDIEDAIDREIKGYSHGMKQKIVVIGSLIHEPKVWVLDEPLTGLDPTASHQIKTIMHEYAKKGNVVFFSSHVIEVVEKICDEICIIGQGKLVGKWKINELKEQGLSLQDLYIKYVTYKGGEAHE